MSARKDGGIATEADALVRNDSFFFRASNTNFSASRISPTFALPKGAKSWKRL